MTKLNEKLFVQPVLHLLREQNIRTLAPSAEIEQFKCWALLKYYYTDWLAWNWQKITPILGSLFNWRGTLPTWNCIPSTVHTVYTVLPPPPHNKIFMIDRQKISTYFWFSFILKRDPPNLKLYQIEPSLAAFIVEKYTFKVYVPAMLPPPPHNRIFMMGKKYPPILGSNFYWRGTLPTLNYMPSRPI